MVKKRSMKPCVQLACHTSANAHLCVHVVHARSILQVITNARQHAVLTCPLLTSLPWIWVLLQASSNQRYDEDASQHMPGSADNQAQSAAVPIAPAIAAQLLQCNLPRLQQEMNPTVAQSMLAVEPLPAVSGTSQQHEPLPAVSGTRQHQTSASNDGLNIREGSVGQQHAAASVNAQGTVVEEELPVSDAETDLSSVGLRHSTQGRHLLFKKQICNGMDTKVPTHMFVTVCSLFA